MKKIALFLLLSAALLTCAKQEKPQALEPNPAAEVISVTGDVKTFTHGEWSPAVAGRVLLATDSLEIPAAAVCELKDVGKNVVQLKGAVKDDVAKLLAQAAPATPAKPASPVKPAKGTSKVLSAVKKLEAKQTVQAATPTAVAGIRGAQGRKPMIADTAKKDTASHK